MNNVQMPADKKAIIKEVTALFKVSKPASFKFRLPLTEGDYVFCANCDKFVETKDFDEAQMGKRPGHRMCASCEEFADMF